MRYKIPCCSADVHVMFVLKLFFPMPGIEPGPWLCERQILAASHMGYDVSESFFALFNSYGIIIIHGVEMELNKS